MKKQPAFVTACHLCGLKVTVPELDKHQCANCPRCNNRLTHFHPGGDQKILAFAISALLFLLLSIPFDFLAFSSKGQQRVIDLSQGIFTLAELDFYSLAVVTFFATLVIPGLVLFGLALMSYQRLRTNNKPLWLKRVHKGVNILLPWSMAEIFLVGTLVSLIKVAGLASVHIGMSFVAFCLFIACLTGCLYYYDGIEYGEWLGKQAKTAHSFSKQQRRLSSQRTWSLLFTATLLYVPANLYPIMHTEFFGVVEPNTILGGVISLWQSGSYPIAAIIFFASVVIPIAKLIVLAWLNWSVQSNAVHLKLGRSTMYKVTEWVGRWSMIDVFVVAILVALIQLGSTISIYPGSAAIAFCAVVFFTMLAAMTFDSRLIWHEDEEI